MGERLWFSRESEALLTPAPAGGVGTGSCSGAQSAGGWDLQPRDVPVRRVIEEDSRANRKRAGSPGSAAGPCWAEAPPGSLRAPVPQAWAGEDAGSWGRRGHGFPKALLTGS